MIEERNIPVTHEWNATVWEWPLQRDNFVTVVNTADKFEASLEVPFFYPNEIEVKVQGADLVIHCEHDRHTDEHGWQVHEVHRCYKLPPDTDVTTLRSHLSRKHLLTVTAKKKK